MTAPEPTWNQLLLANADLRARLAAVLALQEMAIPVPDGVEDIDPVSAFDIGVDTVQLALGEILRAEVRAAVRGEGDRG